MKRVVIVGGGFAGVRCALDLSSENIPDTKVTLISSLSHFEYHPGLYRVVTGKSPLEVCIPLSEIFDGKDVEVVLDTIKEVNLKKKEIKGESGAKYEYDYLVLALGSETSYFDTPGLKDLSFGFKSITEALELKRHLHEEMSKCEILDKDQKVCAMHMVIVGGGPSGVELAGELAIYTKKLAKVHGLDPSVITIDLIQSPERILPGLPEEVSEKAATRLRTLGVNIFLHRKVIREEMEEVYLKDMRLKTNTVIWTAGTVINPLYQTIKGLTFGEKHRVLVDKYLRAKGQKKVFLLGDSAETPFTGMAQTAIYDGSFVAKNIARAIRGEEFKEYVPKPVSYVVPIGPGWAVAVIGTFKVYGYLGWIIRRAADFRFFMSILPLSKAYRAFTSGKTVCESCGICETKYAEIEKSLVN